MITIGNWNVIKEIIVKEDRSSTMQSEFIIGNDSTTNPVTIANLFNDFFVNVGKNLAENIESCTFTVYQTRGIP